MHPFSLLIPHVRQGGVYTVALLFLNNSKTKPVFVRVYYFNRLRIIN